MATVKFTLNSTSSPVAGPLPPVVWPGIGWMPPGSTLLRVVKDPANTIVEKLNAPPELSRESNATSDGEFTRVGTMDVENVGGPLVRPTLESFGKTR